MNESELIIYLLSRKINETTIGATEKELLEALMLTDRNAKFKLLNLLEELNMNISHLGLIIKFNAANNHWFINFKDEISSVIQNSSKEILSSGLAATLFSILLLSISNEGGGKVSVKEVVEVRKKKSIKDHLSELQKLGYISVDGSNIKLTPKIFYFIDIDDIAAEINKYQSENNLK
ncbi:MAG: hypothetical protein GY870_05160 [archaeon]|nr:hypothetical protein [archaeon]